MIKLRNFINDDAAVLQQSVYPNMPVEQIKEMIANWDKKEFQDRYFEMFAVLDDEEIVGTISLYQHSKQVISIGPEVFSDYRRKGFAKEAMRLASDVARNKGYKIVCQQIRTDNVASIALHQSLGFETDGYVYTNRKGREVLIYLKALA